MIDISDVPCRGFESFMYSVFKECEYGKKLTTFDIFVTYRNSVSFDDTQENLTIYFTGSYDWIEDGEHKSEVINFTKSVLNPIPGWGEFINFAKKEIYIQDFEKDFDRVYKALNPTE
jgi:hypothetical protein